MNIETQFKIELIIIIIYILYDMITVQGIDDEGLVVLRVFKVFFQQLLSDVCL